MKNKKTISFIATLSIIVSILISLCLYNQYLTEKMVSTTEKTLYEITMQQQFNVNSEINAQIALLRNISLSMSSIGKNEEFIVYTLDKLIQNTNLEHISLAGIDGTSLTNTGKTIDISNEQYFKKALEGETILTEPSENHQSNKEVIHISMPVINGNDIIGVLTGAVASENIKEAILPTFGGHGYTYIINNKGGIIVSVLNDYTILTSDNFFDMFEKAEFSDGYSYQQLKEDIISGESKSMRYSIDSHMRYAQYMPLAINDWSIVVIVPTEIIAKEANDVAQSTIILILLIIIVLIVLTVLILLIENKNKKNLQRLAFYDDLTGAPTPAKFKIEAQKFMEENKDKNFLMVKFDIQEFKLVNQILGEEVGNNVIINLARALKINTPGKQERYARVHDDEFLVLHIYDKVEDLIEIRDRFQKLFYEAMGKDFSYYIKMISGHYYMTSDNCQNISEAIEKANIAHRIAKQTGCEICVYDKAFIETAVRQKEIEANTRKAIENYEFKVYLQPKYELKNETIIGAEALVRWITDNGEIIFPNEFIPIFEQNQFITTLDFYMLEETCKIINGWNQKGLKLIPISVNFSRLHLFDPEFVNTLCVIADKYNVEHKYLEIEITENVIFENENILTGVLLELHNNGFVLSMDDFGSGYSSLGMLKKIPVDVLKLDRSFFINCKDQERERLIIESVIQLAKKLNISTVAEGVEVKEHIDFLREIGCDIVQGYYYSEPIPAKDFKTI